MALATLVAAGALTSAHLCDHALVGPKWAQNGVVYSVFPRDFSNEGDLAHVTLQIERIHALGVNIIWLLPLQPTGEAKKKGSIGSPYAIRDYEQINPAYGTKKDLQDLVAKAHSVGLRVIIDAVLNHTAWDNTLMTTHPDWYRRNAKGEVVPPLEEWSDVAALDYKNPELRQYMIDLLKYWVTEFNLDGFRFDASDFVPLEFWKEVRAELKKLKPEILLLGEGEKPEALCVAFDLDYDWRFMRAINKVIVEGAPATATIKGVLEEEEKLFPKGSQHLRFSDNHDEERAVVRYGKNGALAASALVFTLNGVPLIYNGMEVGDATESRDPALFEKRSIAWESGEIRKEFTPFYQHMIALRKQHPALIHGQTEWIDNSAEERVLTYRKVLEKESVFVAINLSNQPFKGWIGKEKNPLSLKGWEIVIKD